MSENTKIEWCDHTFNPWWGCEKISPACAHCYAEGFAKRTGNAVWGKLAPRRFFGEKHWEEPLKWNAAAEKAGTRPRVFCASMADVFEEREDLVEPLARLMDLIRRTPELDWLLLTKRPGAFHLRMKAAYMACDWRSETAEWIFEWAALKDPPHNVWIGTTVEDQQRALERIPRLLDIPARVRFLSCEPLLEEVDFTGILQTREPSKRLHWVIAGGESGSQARPMHPDWARSLRDQCTAAGVPFFFKQWGEWHEGAPDCPSPAKSRILAPGLIMGRFGKAKSGRRLDGREWNEFPNS